MDKTKRKKLHGLASKKSRLIVSKAYAELPKLHQAPQLNFFQLKMSYNLSLFFWDGGVGGASVKFQWWIQDFKKGGGGGGGEGT